MMKVVEDVERLTERERQTTDPTRQQILKKLRRTASDTQIRYNRVKCCATTSHEHWSEDTKCEQEHVMTSWLLLGLRNVEAIGLKISKTR